MATSAEGAKPGKPVSPGSILEELPYRPTGKKIITCSHSREKRPKYAKIAVILPYFVLR